MWTAWLLAVIGLVAAHDDSLRSALGAVRRRQRDLSSLYSRPSYMTGQPEDIGYGYQKAAGTAGVFESGPAPSSRLGARSAPASMDKLLTPYGRLHQSAPKRWSDGVHRGAENSAFRERSAAAAALLRAGEEAALVRSLADERSRRRPQANIEFWEEFARNPVSKYDDPEEMEEAEAKELLSLFAGAGTLEDEEPLPWRHSATDLLRRQAAFDERYGAPDKRYPVSKRSASVRNGSGTDPRTAQELSAIFGRSENSTAPPKHEHHETAEHKETHKNLTSPTIPTTSPQPLSVRKKSVDWSHYFGVDRRKRGDTWMMNQAMAAHGLHGNGHSNVNENRLSNRLASTEDAIIDRALKYTGSHLARPPGAREPQHVRDRVAEEIAAAYNLEQLRRALEDRLVANKRGLPQADYDDLDWTDPSADDDGCPVLEELEARCSRATAQAFDKDRVFLPLCMLHQICVLCGGEGGGRGCATAYLREVGSQCGNDGYCRASAAATLAALPPPSPEPAACAAPCLAPFLLP